MKSSDERSKTSWTNYNFSHWFLTSIYAVSIYTVHSLHELTAFEQTFAISHTEEPSFVRNTFALKRHAVPVVTRLNRDL
jgi:hypothetical protein